ncbi:MAG: 1-acyl-sn-glycerol-3-phosphate acyltransferase [Chloroflexi bacterium]|nr:1-acyl-sn-glycerol-3-phosphate acyltransferase [Chloroflexota bacterium]
MSLAHRIVVAGYRGVTRLTMRLDVAQFARVPDHGPLILVANHINLMEAPVIYGHIQPRRMMPLILANRWDMGGPQRFLLDAMEAIPIRRGESDVTAMRNALEVLKAGNILFVAPEGTRSEHGRLQKGHPGVVLLALRSGAPLLPFAHYGVENYMQNMRRLRRTDFKIVVGRPFHLDPGGDKVNRRVRQQMVDEVMYQIAALLPPVYRGAYSDMSAATETYLAFQSN